MNKFILPLSDPRATLETVGGKGMSLAKLTRAGLPVPGGFHITTDAYRLFVSENRFQTRILGALKKVDATDLAALEPVAVQIGEFFAQGKIPTEVKREILDSYAELSNHQSSLENQKSVAVRSSATAEDLPDASFAGQQETYLNIRGEAAVLEAVKKCWASLWTARAIAYRARQNIAPEVVALAVVVQELVFADAAGVLFTVNPVSGRRDELMVTAAWGLGEAIVSGAVTPDTITVNKVTGRLVRQETAEKLVMTVRTDTGTREQPVPERLKKAPVLKNANVRELARLGMEIEALYTAPMDIEWTLAGGKFAIVQARPITALPKPPLEWPAPAPKMVMARGSFAEFLPDPVSSLFGTLAVPIAGKASQAMMSSIGGIDNPDSYIVSVVNGYVYIGLKMTFKVIWSMAIMSTVASKRILTTSAERWTAVRKKLLEVVAKWKPRKLGDLTAAELLEGVREIFTVTAETYTVAQSGTIPTSLSSEMIFSKFYDFLVKRKGEPAAPTFLFGTENQALRAEKSLFDLAAWAKGKPDLVETLLREPADEIRLRLVGSTGSSDWEEFRTRFSTHLAEYGHTVYDLDFSKPLPLDNPAPLLEMLKGYLKGENDPYARQRAALEKRDEMSQRIVKRLDPLRRKWFLKLLKWAVETAPLREDSIADLGLGYPQIRRLLSELGTRLVRGGALQHANDIYWLEAREADSLAAALDRGESLASQAGAVDARKSDWRAMRKTTPPGVVPKNALISKLMPHEDQHGDTLKGTGASAGRVSARACVMRGPEDFSRMQPGDVIVAVTTTPAWTPLFTRASAVVTDIGGPLSHSSIVAREYGIPAVLGTGIATRRIQDGQVITVDGSAGTVSLK